jgi:hypothetical protein
LDAKIAEALFNGPTEHVDWYWWEQTMPEWPKDQPAIYAGPKFSAEAKSSTASSRRGTSRRCCTTKKRGSRCCA